MSEVTIVGAGVCGLVAATAFAEAGFRVRLCEATAELGGDAASWLAGVVVRDAGLAAPFLLSALGLVLTACTLRWLLVSAPAGAPLCGAKP